MTEDEPIKTPTEPPNFALLLPFDSDDPEFARGFEAGRFWSYVQVFDEDDLPSESWTMHASNAEMVMRIADQRGFRASCEIVDETWIEVVLTAADEA